MTIDFRSQRIAQAAFAAVERRSDAAYLGFARSFPTLIHTSGLAQAVAFALAKGVSQREKRQLIDDLCQVLHVSGCGWLQNVAAADGDALDFQARSVDVTSYLRLTRQALQAATWLKRYAEALLSKNNDQGDAVTVVNAVEEST